MSSTSKNPKQAARTLPPPAAIVMLRAKQLAASWPVLYAVTFALALICGAIRGALAYPILWIAFQLIGAPTSPLNDLALLVAYGPPALSLVTLVLPVGGWWWEQRARGRKPTEHERLAFADAIATLKAADPDLSPPRRWFVRDTDDLQGSVYADTLMLTRGLLESSYLQAVIARELGRINTSDARLAAALHRLTTPPLGYLRRGLRTISFLASGGLAFWLTRAFWDAYWRTREHEAERYAAKLGQAAGLARFHEIDALDSDIPIQLR